MFKWVIWILNVILPCVFEGLLVTFRIKIWKHKSSPGQIDKLKFQIIYISFAAVVITLHLMTAFFLLISVILIRRGLIKESMLNMIDLKIFWVNAVAFILAVIPHIFYIIYNYTWNCSFYDS